MIYLVTYDLKKPDKDYTSVTTFLEQFSHCKDLDSVWLLDTTRTATQLRDGLRQLVDADDVVFVAGLSGGWASLKYSCSTWLRNSERRW